MKCGIATVERMLQGLQGREAAIENHDTVSCQGKLTSGWNWRLVEVAATIGLDVLPRLGDRPQPYPGGGGR